MLAICGLVSIFSRQIVASDFAPAMRLTISAPTWDMNLSWLNSYLNKPTRELHASLSDYRWWYCPHYTLSLFPFACSLEPGACLVVVLFEWMVPCSELKSVLFSRKQVKQRLCGGSYLLLVYSWASQQIQQRSNVNFVKGPVRWWLLARPGRKCKWCRIQMTRGACWRICGTSQQIGWQRSGKPRLVLSVYPQHSLKSFCSSPSWYWTCPLCQF